MNGDLSLSQSLGGLRIANPDEDCASQSSSPPPTSPPSAPTSPHRHPSSDALTPTFDVYTSLPSPAPAASENPPSTSTDVKRFPQTAPAATAAVSEEERRGAPRAHRLAVAGYHSGHCPQSFPTTPPEDYSTTSRTLGHRQSMPIGQQAQQQPHHLQNRTRRAYNPQAADRPMSGFFSHPNMSGSGQAVESQYQRVRAESTQSTNTPVQRSNSRRAAAVAPHNSVPVRVASTGHPVYGRPSGPSQTSINSQPRRNSRTTASDQELSPQAETMTLPYVGGTPVPTSTEEWKERGAAVGVQKVIDPTGKTTTRTVRKGVRDFQFGRTLGEGSYSTVLAATDRINNREFAIKVLDKKHIIKERKVKYVNIEKDTLNRLTEHPGIVRLYYTFQDDRSLYFVLDLASGGELLGVLKKTTSFDEECTRFYGAQILDAIEYMHLRGIIHRDLKPENVLLDDQGHVKITDFGTAKILDLTNREFGAVSVNHPMDGSETDRAVSFVGTAEYVSPELLTEKNACKASDLWAFGCIIYQLLAGRPPFKAGNEYQTFQKIVNLEYSFPDGFPPVAKDLVSKLLVLNPAERLAIDVIKQHPFFSGVQWGKGLWKQKAPRLRPFVPHSEEAEPPFARQTSTRIPSNPQVPTQSQQRPQPRIITELAPPSQLDIEWSPVLNKNNERILQLEQLIVYSAPAPHSPTSRNGGAAESTVDTPSRLTRLFGGSATKKRKRLVMVTSGGRLIIAPAEGDRKEAKQTVDLMEPDIVCKSQQDNKGYSVWCVFTRDKHLTFEDPRANTGDPGSSQRSAQKWISIIEDAQDRAANLPRSSSYNEDSFGVLNDGLSSPPGANMIGEGPSTLQSASNGTHMRRTLRKDPSGHVATEEPPSRKRFSRRHSKNGLAAVF